MTQDAEKRRIALLVDAENIKPSLMREVLPNVFKLGRPIIQLAYGDFSNPAAKPWVEFLRKNVIEARQVTPSQSGKNAADIALVVDAMRLLLTGKCDALCIVSSDRDFVALTSFCRAEGFDAYGFGTEKTDRKYRQTCAKFFEVKAADEVAVAAAVPRVKPVVLAVPTNATGPNWPAILQEIGRIAGKEGWVSLQTLGCVLGKRGISASEHGGTNWGQVFSRCEGFEVAKDATGQRSIRIAGAAKAA
ncbi:MAG: NYN domain-containing protein [Novosphingobium sp.]|uniref:NYN domain-containing protein n=1 Tax=Novosphingobium sp. TaxID=1874826 RepID=UPI003B9A7D68